MKIKENRSIYITFAIIVSVIAILFGVVVGGQILERCSNIATFNALSGEVTIKISDDSLSSASGNVYTPDEVKLEHTIKDFESTDPYSRSYLKSTGTVKILVLPVIIPGFELDEETQKEYKEDLESCFFGDSNEYWESVKSFYKKSSYGKLNITGNVLDWYSLKDNQGIESLNQLNSYKKISNAIKNAIDDLNIKVSDYDTDQDNNIDAIWVIYSCPDYKDGKLNDYFTDTEIANKVNQFYWAFTSWANEDEFNLYGWASYDFMYKGVDEDSSFTDAHTFIHETGHMLGLNDYYDYSETLSPVGVTDMMDFNILDHNSYSKMILGWTKPFIVNGDCSITLGTMESENNVIIVPGDDFSLAKVDGKIVFNAFSEYLLIEYYTPTDLNELDAFNKYSNKAKGSEKAGFRIYHVDNRLFKLRNRGSTDSIKCYIEDYTIGTTFGSYEYSLFLLSNSCGKQYGENLLINNLNILNADDINEYFCELAVIDKEGTSNYITLHKNGNTFDMLDEDDLFIKGDDFIIDNYKGYFANSTDTRAIFDDGESFTSNIYFR